MVERTRPYFEQYKEFVGVMVNEMGWPEWPPKETPPLTHWWEQETQIRPSSFRYPLFRFVDVVGPPKGGKSSLSKSLQGAVTEEFAAEGWTLDLLADEPFFRRSGQLLFVFAPMVHPELDEDDVVIPLETDDWTTSFCLQREKTVYWGGRIRNALLWSMGYRNPTVLVGYRGSLDTIIWAYALATHKEDPAFTIPREFWNSFVELEIPTLAKAGSQFLQTSAHAFVGLKQEVAKSRGDQPVKGNPRWVTDSPFFNTLSAWYGYFLKNVIPKLNKVYGTGILVLNGEKDLDSNVRIYQEYIRSLIKRG